MPMTAWETEDGNVVVWGTHDPEVAALIIEKAIQAGTVIMDPFGDEDDDQYKEEFWEWIGAGPQTLRWAHQSLIDEEDWPRWLILNEHKEHTKPFMVFVR